MNSFLKNVELYRSIDPDGQQSVQAISLKLNWPNHVSYLYKFLISELTNEELDLLDKSKEIIDPEIIAAVCIQNEKYRNDLVKNIDRINAANSPLKEIEVLITEVSGTDPLTMLRREYWLEVGNYLKEREINKYPFNGKSIGFIKSIGYNGYDSLTTGQKKYIFGLIKADKERIVDDRFFCNEHLIHKGFGKECKIMESYIPCP